MKSKTMHNNIRKATIEMLLLKLLQEEDMYGYQMTQECKKRSDEQFLILEGSMYPILYRLEEDNYISSYQKKAGKRLKRIYYHLEPAGKEHLETLIKEFHNSVALVESLLNSKAGQKIE